MTRDEYVTQETKVGESLSLICRGLDDNPFTRSDMRAFCCAATIKHAIYHGFIIACGHNGDATEYRVTSKGYARVSRWDLESC
jgi:hypothetical protein